MFQTILDNVQTQSPIIHFITNYVTVNDCANITLATGASPIMADDLNEAADITAICQALVINIGTLNERTIAAMILAGQKANALGHPVILDPVGAGASQLRNETIKKLLDQVRFSVIRGNISEIQFLAGGSATTKGVDASDADCVTDDNVDKVVGFARQLSQATGAVIVITGAIDLVVDNEQAYVIRNGHPMMAKVTGTGCMLTSVIGSYVAANPQRLVQATVCAVAAMGLCGQLAYEQMAERVGGTNTYRMLLIDFMSNMTGELLEGGQQVERR